MKGVVELLGRAASALIAGAKASLERLGEERRAERLRTVRLFLLTATVGFAGPMAVLMATLLAVYLLPPHFRATVPIILAGAYLAILALLVWMLRRCLLRDSHLPITDKLILTGLALSALLRVERGNEDSQ